MPKVIRTKDPILRLTDQGLLMSKRPGPNARGMAVVVVDLEKLDAELAQHPTRYVGPGGEGEIEGRIQGAHSFFEKAREERIPVHMSEIHLTSSGSVDVGDGRHRLAAFRERGVKYVPVAVDKVDAEKIAERFGADPGDRVLEVTGEERRTAHARIREQRRQTRERIEADRRSRARGVEVAPAPTQPPPPVRRSRAPGATPPSGRRPAVPKLAEQVFRAHLDQLHRHVEQNGARGLTQLYKDARLELLEQLRRVGPLSKSVEARSIRAMLAQVDAVTTKLGRNLKRHLEDTGALAVELGAKHGVTEFRALSQQFTGTTPVLNLETASVFRGLVKDVESSLLRRYSIQAGTWTASSVLNMERRLTTSAATGKHLEKVVDDLVAELDTERWKAERIVRTEMAYAHGSSKQRAIQETAKDLGIPLFKRLIETFDDRTGDDSFLNHGQTVPVDAPFVEKRKRRGGWELHEFMHPPNRPNDRAVVIPWNPEWEESKEEKPLTLGELRSAPPTRWRAKVGVKVPPGHRPGKAYGRENPVDPPPPEETPSPPAADVPSEIEEQLQPPPPPPPPPAPAPAPEPPPEKGKPRLVGRRTVDIKPGALKHAEELLGRKVTPEELIRLAGVPDGGGTITLRAEKSQYEHRNQLAIKVDYVKADEVVSVGGKDYYVQWVGNQAEVQIPEGPKMILPIEKGGTVRQQEGQVPLPPGVLEKIQKSIDRDPITEYTSNRAILRDEKGPYLKNEYLGVSPQGTGLGTDIFARQVEEAAKLGVDRIKTDAARGPNFNGYYTWARLGYDGELSPRRREEFGVQRVSEVVSTKEGLERWKEKGESFEGVFDTRPGSYSRKVLEEYQKGKKR